MTHLCQMMAQVEILLAFMCFDWAELATAQTEVCSALRLFIGVLGYKSNDKAVARHFILCKFIIFCVILHLSAVRLRNNLYICIDLG